MAKIIIAANIVHNTEAYKKDGLYYVDQGVGTQYVISHMCLSRESALQLFAKTNHKLMIEAKNAALDVVRKSACHSCGLAAAGLTGSCADCPMYKIATELQKTFKREKKFLASLAAPAKKMV